MLLNSFRASQSNRSGG